MMKKLFFTPVFLTAFSLFGQNIIFSEGFDTDDDIAQWENLDLDGDEQFWEFYDAEEDDMPAFSGNFATSWSWYLEAFTPDNALVSPVISLPDTEGELTLSFDVGAFDEELFEEHYAVYVIPANSEFTGNEEAVFEETLDAGYTQTAKNIEIVISDFKGEDVQLVFRHYDCTDIAFIGIDNIEITESEDLGVSDLQKNLVNIYPNPATEFIKIEGTNEVEKIRILDMQGRIVLETKNSEANIQALNPGVYVVNIYSENKVISRKLIKK